MNKKVKIIILAGFLLAAHFALVSYINSSFLSAFVGEGRVGLIYVASSIVSILALIGVPKFFRILGGYRFILIASFLNALCLLALSSLGKPMLVIPVFIIYFALSNLVFFSLDELLEIFSDSKSVGRMRGVYLTAINLAWVLSQASSTQILQSAELSFMYFIAFGIMVLFFTISMLGLRDIPDPKYDRISPFKSLNKFFKNRNLARSYGINFLLQFFYSWMVIYTPIYLSAHLGFAWSDIAKIFTVMLIPFVLIQFPLGRYADKVGERSIMIFGFLIAAAATLSIFFITKHTVFIWAALLCMTRIGAATIEVMSDVYFFKHINKENDEFIGIYRNTGPVAYIISPILGFAVFYLTPDFKFIFPILSMLMLLGAYLAYTIKKSDI